MAATGGHLEVVRTLLEVGADKDKATTDTGATPLFTAAVIGHLEVVRTLLEAGADKDKASTDTGATPLFMAAENGHLEVVRTLLEAGADNDRRLRMGVAWARCERLYQCTGLPSLLVRPIHILRHTLKLAIPPHHV